MKTRTGLLVLVAAFSIHCSNGTEGTPAAASDDVTAAKDDVEYTCTLPGSKSLDIMPAYGEIHRVDYNEGTWSMDDGLSIETRGKAVSIHDDEGGLVAEIDETGAYTEGAEKGTCEAFTVKKVAFSSAPFQLTDGLEYHCSVKGGLDVIIRPKYGEIDEIDLGKGTFASLDGMSFTLKSLERMPPVNEISGVDDEGGAVGRITEDDNGATWTNGDQTGSCEKLQRTKLN